MVTCTKKYDHFPTTGRIFLKSRKKFIFLNKVVEKNLYRGYTSLERCDFMAGRYEIDMCNGRLFSKIIRCALPVMAANILQLLYNAVDIIVVGRYVGETALAAVGSTSSLINMIINVFIGISVGASVVVAQSVGAKDYNKSSDSCHTAIAIGLISGVFLMFFGIIACRPLLILMGSPENVIDQATVYMRIYFCGMPAFMLMTYGSALMRTVGDTKRPLFYFSFSGILNVVLNLILVIKFNMGVAGVAIATIFSQYVSALLILYALTHTDGHIQIHLKDLRIVKECLVGMIAKGLPAGIQSFIFGASNVIIQSSINSFGSVVIAGSAAAANLEGFLYTAQNTYSVIATSFAGQNFGAKKYKRIDKTLVYCMLTVFVIGVSISTLIYTFSETLLGVYAPGNIEAISYGITRFRYILLTYFLCGLMEVTTGVIRGIGRSITPMIMSVIGVCGVRIMWVLTVFPKHRNLGSLFISYPISWFVTLFMLIFAYLILRRKLFKKESL